MPNQNNFKTSQNGINLIKEFEGFVPSAYYCAGQVLTIGWGHTKTVKRGMVINEAQGEALLRQDLQGFEDDVNGMVEVPLNQNQFDALISFIFNLGTSALFKSTLLRLLNAGDYKGAADQFPRWNKANGKVLKGLIRRREMERRLFLK